MTGANTDIGFCTSSMKKINRRPAQWVRFGKAEQRHERALPFAKVRTSDIELAPI